jgi:hypothetical protein
LLQRNVWKTQEKTKTQKTSHPILYEHKTLWHIILKHNCKYELQEEHDIILYWHTQPAMAFSTEKRYPTKLKLFYTLPQIITKYLTTTEAYTLKHERHNNEFYSYNEHIIIRLLYTHYMEIRRQIIGTITQYRSDTT